MYVCMYVSSTKLICLKDSKKKICDVKVCLGLVSIHNSCLTSCSDYLHLLAITNDNSGMTEKL